MNFHHLCFFHLLKAFDMLNNDIIFSEFFTYDAGGLTHELLRSYRENRQQCVTINNTKSSIYPIN